MTFTVLTIDDEPEIVLLVQALLEREGYRVLGAHGATGAMEILARERPDLILCDVMMSEVGGIRLVKQLKADPLTADIPVIMISALSGSTTVTDGWLAGADMYLTKPFNPEEMLAVIRRFVPHNEASAAVYDQAASR